MNASAKTILVAEDDSDLRTVVKELLELEGFEVLTAGDGCQALEAARARKEKIDYFLTDVLMPKLDGPAAAAELASVHPEAKVIYMSGHPGSVLAQHGLSPGSGNFIAKPFAIEDLLAKMRGVAA